MLALFGFLTVGLFLVLVMTKRVSVMVSLILVPLVFAMIGGFAPAMGKMMLDGITKVAPTGIMVGFAVLYFGLMID